MNVQIIGNEGITTIPTAILTDVFTRLGQERTWSDVDQTVVQDNVVAITANGCADVYIYDDAGYLMGAGIIIMQWDCHVGDMYTMLGMYVWPEYRHLGVASRLLKTLRTFALNDPDVNWYAYGQQRRPGVFETHYKRVRPNHGQRSTVDIETIRVSGQEGS